MSWLTSKAYDDWKCNPPEEKKSNLICDDCDNFIFPEDVFYRIDGCVMCEDCAKYWLDQQGHTATEEECFGVSE